MARKLSESSRLLQLSLDTLFHIDYEWWDNEGRDLRVYLQSHLCSRHREVFDSHEDQLIDWVDDVTAEVTRVNGVEHALRVHCSQQEDYISDRTSLVDAVFRVFLANGNQPLATPEIARLIERPPDVILRTLSSTRVYKGLRALSN